MAQKKNNQDIVNSIAAMTGVSKAQAANFLQNLAETIVEGLQTDGKVEIDGMGTLGTVKMAGRESVNVANGERIVIDAFTKFTFAPAFKSLFAEKQVVQGSEESENEDTVTEDAVAEDTVADVAVTETGNDDEKDETPQDDSEVNEEDNEEDNEEMEEYPADDVPPVKEKPADAFSGIDVLISTPESLEDVRQRLSEAKQKEVELAGRMNSAQTALEQAQKVFDEVKTELEAAREVVKTMEENVENVENNRKAVIDKDYEDECHTATENTDTSGSHLMDNKKNQHDTGEDSGANWDEKKRRMWIIAAAACVFVALLCLLFCGKQQPEDRQQRPETASSQKSGSTDDESAKKEKPQESQAGDEGQTTAGPSEKAEDIGEAQQPDNQGNVSQSNAENNLNGTNLIRVDTVVYNGNDLLENIVTKHYGEHDMVYRVIRFNRKNGQLNDLTHIPAGTKILMPHYK